MPKPTLSFVFGGCLLLAGCAAHPAVPMRDRGAIAATDEVRVASPFDDPSTASPAATRPHAFPAPASPAIARAPVGRPLEQVFVRVEGFHDVLEWDELKVDYEDAADVTFKDAERERTGVRVSFGPAMVGGYFQVFAEEFTSPALLTTSFPALGSSTFDGFGIGAGVQGAPTVIDGSTVDMVIPFRYGFDVAGGVEDAAGIDNTWIYVESQLQAGVGARVFGLQPSVGFLLDSVFGVVDSDDPASPANSDIGLVDGINFGGYAEVLYKPTAVPLIASVRGVFGQNSGVFFSFGVAF